MAVYLLHAKLWLSRQQETCSCQRCAAWVCAESAIDSFTFTPSGADTFRDIPRRAS